MTREVVNIPREGEAPAEPRVTEHTAVARRAFTLVEVMVSILLVLLVVFGVSQVFSLSSKTIGAGQALSVAMRDGRAAQSTFAEDWRSFVPDSPLMFIYSGTAYGVEVDNVGGASIRRGFRAGFWNKSAYDAAITDSANYPNPFLVDGNNDSKLTPGEPLDRKVKLLETDDRNPRMDRLGFFVQGRYALQQNFVNASKNGFVSASASQAFVWYGHLALDNGQAALTADMLPNNQFAENRILGRACILLNDQADPGLGVPKPPVPSGVSPLDPFNVAKLKTYDLRRSETDLVRFPLDQIRAALDAAYANDNKKQEGVGTAANPYWASAFCDNYTTGQVDYRQVWRFYTRTSLSRPVLPQDLSRTGNIFVNNCTQFIVEYAGDYLFQDPDPTPANPQNSTRGRIVDGPSGAKGIKSYINGPTGAVQYGETDGEIDWVWDRLSQTKQIRWYGRPRDTNGDGRIDINDVVPLWYVINYSETGGTTQYKDNNKGIAARSRAPWEVGVIQPPGVACRDGEDLMKIEHDQANPRQFQYNCAFHNDAARDEAPRMIRITMKIDDPGNRLQNGQWYQFVLTR